MSCPEAEADLKELAGRGAARYNEVRLRGKITNVSIMQVREGVRGGGGGEGEAGGV